MLVIETLACVAATFVGERAGALFSQTVFRSRRWFANEFSNKTRQLGSLIRYFPNFMIHPVCPLHPPPIFFFIGIILNFS